MRDVRKPFREIASRPHLGEAYDAGTLLGRHRRALLAGALACGLLGGGVAHLMTEAAPSALVASELEPTSRRAAERPVIDSRPAALAQADVAEPKRPTRPEPAAPPQALAPIAPPSAPASARPTPVVDATRVQPASQPFSFADLVDRVRPAVVSIRAEIGGASDEPSLDDEGDDDRHPLERFFRDRGDISPRGRGERMPQHDRGPVQQSQGSGFFISADGRVVTNFHVVKGATTVTVVTDEGKEYPARVVGRDERTDIALLAVDASGVRFPTVPFATSEIRVGDWVVAVGNPFGLGGTVTAGIVSARGREIGAGPYDDFLQIDAPINRGNSGGPTFNLDGEVVAMNTAIFSPSGGSVGIGFGIPAATVQRVVAQLDRGGEVVRGWLGVRIQPVTPDLLEGLGVADTRGAVVTAPEPGSPADRAGLRAGDTIVAVDGKPVVAPRDLSRRIADYPPGTIIKVSVVRRGRTQDLQVTLGKLPAQQR